MTRLAKTFALLLILPLAAHGSDMKLQVTFNEGAPKDSFTIRNTGNCPVTADVQIELAKSAGALIFDTTAAGAGVEVFQPLEVAQGKKYLRGIGVVSDGDQIMRLSLAALSKDKSVRLTIDVDDQLAQSDLGQIRVSDSEIAGAEVTVQSGSDSIRSVFGNDSRAEISVGACS